MLDKVILNSLTKEDAIEILEKIYQSKLITGAIDIEELIKQYAKPRLKDLLTDKTIRNTIQSYGIGNR